MSLTLTVDGDRWRAHLRAVVDADPTIVPVCKGNGYGLTLRRLARKAAWLGVDTIAVGTYAELPELAGRYDGRLLVLTPWRPFTPDLDPALHGRVIHTVSRPDDLAALLERQPGARYVLERMTSMRRHGLSARELWALAPAARRGRLEGVALHLPLAHGGHFAEAVRLVNDVVAADLPGTTVWVSHLTPDELGRLRAAYPDLTIRSRTGTALWLGDRSMFSVSATVLDAHPIRRGESFGYRERSAPGAGHLLIVSGGTAHGIGLEAPTGDASLRARAATVARGGLDALGRVRSPYSLDGRTLLFAEPPHMQASMLLLPDGARVPEVGEQLDLRVRYTATTFDRVDVT